MTLWKFEYRLPPGVGESGPLTEYVLAEHINLAAQRIADEHGVTVEELVVEKVTALADRVIEEEADCDA